MDTQQLILNRNPFAAPTEEAIGADFIGRKSVLKEMHKYVINADKISNYHIVGLPRIGKSSLLKAFKAMVLENHYSHDLVVFYISLDECNSPNDMWRIIGKGIRKELKNNFDHVTNTPILLTNWSLRMLTRIRLIMNMSVLLLDV